MYQSVRANRHVSQPKATLYKELKFSSPPPDENTGDPSPDSMEALGVQCGLADEVSSQRESKKT